MARAFFDTNVLIYAARDALKPEDEAKRLVALQLLETEDIVTSGQVMAEFYHNAVKKGEYRLTPEEAEQWIDMLGELPCAAVDLALVKAGVHFCERYKISYWDGAMLAAANDLDASIFYSEDLNHGQRYGAVTVINPFIPQSH
jgi:predicted nucleic acid-binding protein